MKTYIVYDSTGNEVGYWRGASHNAAEQAAKKQHGERAMVTYTELGRQFDHIKSGFFTDADAKPFDVNPSGRAGNSRWGW